MSGLKTPNGNVIVLLYVVGMKSVLYFHMYFHIMSSVIPAKCMQNFKKVDPCDACVLEIIMSKSHKKLTFQFLYTITFYKIIECRHPISV